MIGYLRGRPILIENESVILDVHGVGYELLCSLVTLETLSLKTLNLTQNPSNSSTSSNPLSSMGNKSSKDFLFTDEIASSPTVLLYIYTHVREDIFQLYGFSHKKEKELFCSLIKVNGIGPKVALGILSACPFETLIHLIAEKNVKDLAKLPKIGRKKAEQIILSLKDVTKNIQYNASVFPARNEIFSALLHLGFKSTEIENVVNKLNPSSNVEEGVRHALSELRG